MTNLDKLLARARRLTMAAALILPLFNGVIATAQNSSPQDTGAQLLALANVLRAKGVVSPQEVDRVLHAAGASEQLAALLSLLQDKGILDSREALALNPREAQAGDEPTLVASAVPLLPAGASASGRSGGPERRTGMLAMQQAPAAPLQPAQDAPPTPSVALPPRPVETLPLLPNPPSGPLTLRLGSGAIASVNGFIKTNLIHASNESSGDDIPLFARVVGTGPESANSTGTSNKPNSFRVKTRSIRTGVSFMAPDVNKKFDISSVFEFDWEGNYSITTNNNIGAIRSPAPRLRIAYVRLDTKLGGVPVFLKVGQDWSLFTSSTMPSGIESTGVYVFQGVTWERLPGLVAGARFELGGKWKWRVQPEAGILMGLGGEGIFENPFSATPGSGLGGVFTGNVTAPGQTGISTGQREGANAGRPHVESRVVMQFSPFGNRAGVVPSQFIVSFEAADRARIFAPPYTNEKPEELRNFILKTQSLGYTAEFRLATPWSTVLGKYYRGSDLRQFFGGLAQDVFYDGPSPFGGSTVLPRMLGVRSQGGFIEWQLPISALVKATRPALQGFSANLYYGTDRAFGNDARRTGNRLAQHGLMGDFIYQYNRFVQFGMEVNWTEMLYTARQGGPLRGGNVGTDLRKEFTTTFTF